MDVVLPLVPGSVRESIWALGPHDTCRDTAPESQTADAAKDTTDAKTIAGHHYPTDT